jgi:mRNA interferase RelE/StbE
MFDIVFERSVGKDLKRVDKHSINAILRDIELLKNFPAVDVKKLLNHPIAEYRFRVGKYRVLFDVDGANRRIVILRIAHRKDVYR